MVYKTTDVSIIIPNWNGKELLEKNLPAVVKASHGSEILVIDDNSNDDSVFFLEKKYPSIHVIKKNKNEGFASTVTVGAKHATKDILVLLNTDIEPQSDFLTSLLPHFEDENVFAVGCLDKSEENGKEILRGRGVASWHKGFYIHKRGEVDKTDTAWVSGGSGAFRKSLWEKLGGLDVLYNPFYWEDIDVSYRARKAGYTVLFEPKSIVIHRHEEGKIKSSFSPKQIQQIAYRNQFIFIWKNLSDPEMFFIHIFWLKIRLLQGIFRADWAMVKGYMNAVSLLPIIWNHRRKQSVLWKLKDKDIT